MTSLNLAPLVPTRRAAPKPAARSPAPGPLPPQRTIAKPQPQARNLHSFIDHVRSTLPQGARLVFEGGEPQPHFGTTRVLLRRWCDKSTMRVELLEATYKSTRQDAASFSGIFFQAEGLLLRYPRLQHLYCVKALPRNATRENLPTLVHSVVRHVLRTEVLAHVAPSACTCRNKPRNLSEHSLEWEEMRLKRAYHQGMELAPAQPQLARPGPQATPTAPSIPRPSPQAAPASSQK